MVADNYKIITENIANQDIKKISKKIIDNQRISPEEGIALYEKADLGLLGFLANHVRERKNGHHTFFNCNFHIEPTNICIYQCKFCSYKRKMNEPGAWEYTLDEIAEKARNYKGSKITEIHIVGGVHPHRDLHYYGRMLQIIKEILPGIHIKAFTAVELDYMIKKAGLNLAEGLSKLKEYGLDSIPGGGAEIFDPEIRNQLCKEKSNAESWITIHKTAHKAGLSSNATMLYGHIESYAHRIDHMLQLRNLQDETNGFNAFIPLKFRKANNFLSHIGEVSIIEDLKNYAVSRIFLDNFMHLKAYWPMIGKEIAQLSLAFGVDDVDGTIDDSTKIYTMAGVKEKNTMTTEELIQLIRQVGRVPVERDSLYNIVRIY
jgi:aminodeoxyfutalosine synthase